MTTSTTKTNRNKNYKLLLVLVPFTAIFAIWQTVTVYLGEGGFFPSPLETFRKLLEIIREPYFWITIFHTVRNVLVSFILSFTAAFILGILSGVFNWIRHIVSPFVSLIKAIPTISLILIAVITINPSKAPVFICCFIIFPILFSNVYNGIKNIDHKLIELAECYKIKKFRIIKEIYIPSIKNYLYAGIQSALGLNFKVMIAAEVIGFPKDTIGEKMYYEKINIEIAGVLSWTFLVVIIVIIFDLLVKWVFKRREGNVLS